ncbi:hypothetical protein WI617_19800, partial [Salmonella enterica subsp. enterica serovar Corvallis]
LPLKSPTGYLNAESRARGSLANHHVPHIAVDEGRQVWLSKNGKWNSPNRIELNLLKTLPTR